MSHAYGGPDQVPNGVVLCTFHHRAFDLGVIGVEREAGQYRRSVSNESNELTAQSSAFTLVLDVRGKPLHPPSENGMQFADKYVA